MKTKIIILVLALIFVLVISVTGTKVLASDDTASDANDDVIKDELSKSNSWYSQAADSLMEAFIPGVLGEGTDEETVFRIMRQLETESDWNKLVSKFGMRSEGWGFSKHSLIEWLKSELSYGEQSDLRTILSAIDVHVI